MNPVLTENEVFVLEQRANGITLKQIGDRLNLTIERIRQIEAKAKRKKKIKQQAENNPLLTLSVRVQHCLRNLEIKTIEELVETPPRKLLRKRNFGKKCLQECISLLQKHGYITSLLGWREKHEEVETCPHCGRRLKSLSSL